MARSSSLVGVVALLVLPFTAGCDEGSSAGPIVAAVRIDACQPAVIVLDPGVSASQELGVHAAIDLWNRGASTRLEVKSGDKAGDLSSEGVQPPLPLHFRQAAAPSHGFFDPGTGQLLINDDLTAHALAVTIAHEVGHAFGLVHVSDRPSVMGPGNLDVEPTEGDFAALADIWGRCGPAADARP